MKKLIKILPLIILSAGLLFNGPVACKSPEHAAFVATTSVTQLADNAIGAFDAYDQANPGKVSTEDVLRVRRIALEYKASVNAARIAQNAYAAVKGTPRELDAKTRADAAVTIAENAAQNLSQLIYTIVPSLQRK